MVTLAEVNAEKVQKTSVIPPQCVLCVDLSLASAISPAITML